MNHQRGCLLLPMKMLSPWSPSLVLEIWSVHRWDQMQILTFQLQAVLIHLNLPKHQCQFAHLMLTHEPVRLILLFPSMFLQLHLPWLWMTLHCRAQIWLTRALEQWRRCWQEWSFEIHCQQLM